MLTGLHEEGNATGMAAGRSHSRQKGGRRMRGPGAEVTRLTIVVSVCQKALSAPEPCFSQGSSLRQYPKSTRGDREGMPHGTRASEIGDGKPPHPRSIVPVMAANHLQPAQDEAEQPPHPDPGPDDDDSPEPFPMPNFDRRFVVFLELQAGHTTSGFVPKTSFSKQQLQLSHRYS